MNSQRVFIVMVLFFSCFLCSHQCNSVETCSTLMPNGSGARALSMGGAFIAIANDATAASWNPAGIVQLGRPELSIIYAQTHRVENNHFQQISLFSGKQGISNADINYFSLTYPFFILNRNISLSLNYQNLYDLNREWSLENKAKKIKYQLNGNIGAYGFVFSFRLIKNFSIGVTINFWKDWIDKNGWTEKQMDIFIYDEFEKTLKSAVDYDIDGINANIGMLWRLNENLTLGAVYKTPFNAELQKTMRNGSSSKVIIQDETLEFPASYGIGVACQITEDFTLSADFYRTNWQHFIHRDSFGNSRSAITNEQVKDADVKAVNKICFGLEYRFPDYENNYEIPVRCGFFSDPAPASHKTDKFWGISFGAGWVTDIHCIDIAYQFRWANQVREYLVKGFGEFSQNVKEHSFYSSYVYHF